jgi:predicted DNA-binding transcriptional regulator YafY
MSYRSAIKRYLNIIELLESDQFPSSSRMIERLHEEGIKTSERTFQRDLQALKDEFGIEVSYNKNKNGYYIDYELSTDFKTFLRIIEILNTADIIADTIKENKSNLKYLSFDSASELKGIAYLKDILKAIKSQQIISFIHQPFHQEKGKKTHLKPYGLKEYMNRWYVVGEVQGLNEIRTYGIDRISELKVTDKKFIPNDQLQPLSNFEDIIGVVYYAHPMTDVILSFTPTQGKYIKTLPFHHSQKIIVDNDEELRISLKLKPNYELTQKIMMLHHEVKVIEPQWLADEILEKAQKIVKKYS